MKNRIMIAVLGFVALLAITGALKSQFFSDEGELGGIPLKTITGGSSNGGSGSVSGELRKVPVKGIVTMLDLGADSCIPCKMMAPIMAKLEKGYKGRAAIILIDVWKHRDQAKRFGIRAIPTQIFFNKEGKEVYRHVGFMSETAIVGQLKKMGVV